MPDQEDFFFEQDPPIPPAGGKKGRGGPRSPAAGKNKKGGSLRRTLLLLVLLILVAAAAAAYFYPSLYPSLLSSLLQPKETPKPAAAQRQPVTLPARPTPPAKPAAVVEAKKPSSPAPAADKGVVRENLPQQKPAAVEEVPARTTRDEEPPASKAAPPAAKANANAPASDPKPEVRPKAAPAGRYTLQAGAYIDSDNLRRAKKRVRSLGYEPVLIQAEKKVEMTRLRLGTFPVAEAKGKLKQLSALAPGAFYLDKGNRWVVYAGSYYDLDRARSFADQLYEQGIRLTEEQVMTTLPLTIVRFGDFSDLASARKAAARARAAGLEIFMVKQR